MRNAAAHLASADYAHFLEILRHRSDPKGVTVMSSRTRVNGLPL
jgi:hypothetical protein